MRRLVIVRPEPGASATLAKARDLGIDGLAMPLFEIEPVAWETPEASGFGGLLLTSANALRHGGGQLGALRGLRVYAVGEATAEAARAAGFDIAGTGDAGVERLLGSIDSGLRLLHLCGEHRTPVAAAQAVTAVPVYRAAELPAPGGLARIAGQTAAVHSPRAGRRLAELVDQACVDRSLIRIAAISDAAVAAVGGGWDACESAAAPDERALLALAARLCDCYGR